MKNIAVASGGISFQLNWTLGMLFPFFSDRGLSSGWRAVCDFVKNYRAIRMPGLRGSDWQPGRAGAEVAQ